MTSAITLGRTAAGAAVTLPLALANRHGLITGATGTGKTVTLQRLAEGFSRAGVPVFMADIKGDLSGLAAAGASEGPAAARAADLAIAHVPEKFPVAFWDLFGERGMPLRTSAHEMGPLLLARMLGLNETQEGVLNIAFRWNPWGAAVPLRDLHDLRARLSLMLDHLEEIRAHYGNVAAAPVAVIQRAILVLDTQGGHHLFGEPALEIADFLRTDADGRGVINLLAADRLMDTPKLYATFLLWLLSALFRALPEAGDLAKPKLVFFFDEAHLLFADAPKRLLETIERMVRLVRSKGVGVYFVTQSPRDVPDAVAAQLGHRIQHALRVYTPKDRIHLKAVAAGFRPNPEIKVADVVTTLATGEALVSTLIADGVPAPVERVRIAPPASRIGPVSNFERDASLRADPLAAHYRQAFDRVDQFRRFCERLAAKGELPAEAVAAAFEDAAPARRSWFDRLLRRAA